MTVVAHTEEDVKLLARLLRAEAEGAGQRFNPTDFSLWFFKQVVICLNQWNRGRIKLDSFYKPSSAD